MYGERLPCLSPPQPHITIARAWSSSPNTYRVGADDKLRYHPCLPVDVLALHPNSTAIAVHQNKALFFRKINEHARIGQELEKILTRNFGNQHGALDGGFFDEASVIEQLPDGHADGVAVDASLGFNKNLEILDVDVGEDRLGFACGCDSESFNSMALALHVGLESLDQCGLASLRFVRLP